eukprot:TRINITY_DN8259_c0_g1_i1.p1 TRINITY_DN8259_c0_g1~~TRINITY_DN8259_c0_g1_i1.p1  ORF type:complete len:202 (+),score=47.80 TRINITY_DN8259_c0_g1_i1:44-649(+)
MKIVAAVVMKSAAGREPNDPRILTMAEDLTSYGYFQRGSIKEFLVFFTKTICERTPVGGRQSVKHEEYNIHIHKRSDGLAGVLVCDMEYPPRVAFSFINKFVEEFSNKYKSVLDTASMEQMPFPQLADMIAKYQDPAQADSMMRLQKDLEETKQIMTVTIEQVLQRGEKLDNLVERSNDLSGNSKMFYKQAAKTNSCCTIS